MVAKEDFTYTEWTALMEGPYVAGVLVILASPNLMGIAKEAIAMTRSARSAEAAGAATELVELLIADMEDMDEGDRFEPEGDSDEVTAEMCDRLASTASVADARFDPDVAAGYKDWVAKVALVTAEASKEGSFLGIGGTRVTDKERATLTDIDRILGRRP